MRFIILNTFYESGGAEIQAQFEFDYLIRNGHEALLLTFDPQLNIGESKKKGHYNIVGNYSKNQRRANDLFINYELAKKIKKIINDFKPDIIHIHQITYALNTICYACNGVLTIQTIHDASILCDKGANCTPDDCICTNFNFYRCLSRCYNQSIQRRIKYIYRYIVIRRNVKFRKKYIRQFITPSEWLQQYLLKYNFNAQCINNAIDVIEFNEFKKRLSSDKKILLYFGAVCRRKGVFHLLNAFESDKYPNLELHIIGRIDNARGIKPIDLNAFKKKTEEKNVVYHGPKSHKEIIGFLQSTFAVIVPSLWMENYPTTAIEGILGKCIVCGSDRGGVPELVVDKRLIFDVCNRADIERCLRIVNDMNSNEYDVICKRQIQQFVLRNMPGSYFEKLFKLIYNSKEEG